ncbi:sensor histidine kinase [Compostibacter hankyongensis]|uniref:Histidine kinase n=1 Tax=Compostibacter hankyongensis TaxID=1007089 RepID=A0ABP8FI12_9BACT
MFKNISRYYWWCQLGGWLSWLVLNTIVYLTLGRVNTDFLIYQLFLITSGFVVTHLLRTMIVHFHWLEYSLDKVIIRSLIAVIVCGVLIALMLGGLNGLLHFDKERTLFDPKRLLGASFLVMVWTMIYFLWHYFQKDQQYKMDRLQLESVVKGLELRTIKSQLNPHFIFNALNSIRALVDENPQRARTAITELSNILRSSMQLEKMETVRLEDELSIVRDYLALELIRFEERLKVQYHIDPETLDLPVPPMMLQTLVENALKHGISKSIRGGVVEIVSRIVGLQHEITIRNTGHLSANVNEDGFGLKSTRQRLELLYRDKASFQIYNGDDQLVETKIRIPL